MYRKLTLLIIFIIFVLIAANSIKFKDLSLNNEITVQITGEVKNPMLINLPLGSKYNDLLKYIEQTESSDLSQLPLLEVLKNNEIVVIPSKRTENLISINNANLYELSCLPGIGKSIAKRIIDYRNECGGFAKLEDLMNVEGIKDKKFNAIKEYICL